MTREMLSQNYQTEVTRQKHRTLSKNGVELEGIRILTDSNIAPVIYTKAIIENAEK